MSYLEFNKKFPNELSVINYFIEIRYKNRIVCPKCGDVYHQQTRPKVCHCNNCKSEFSIFKIPYLKNQIRI
ncbi:MAG: transposase [Endomicrobium sp.]|nr:transposase [Endomicrobium sp.]